MASGSLLLAGAKPKEGTWKKWSDQTVLSDRSSVAVEGFWKSTCALSTLVRSPVCAQPDQLQPGSIQQQNQVFRLLDRSLNFRTTCRLQGMRAFPHVDPLPAPPFFRVAPGPGPSLMMGPVCPPQLALHTRCPSYHSNQPEEVFGTRHLEFKHRTGSAWARGDRPTARTMPLSPSTVNCLHVHHKYFPGRMPAAWADAMCAQS